MKRALSAVLALCVIIAYLIPVGAYYDALLNAYNDPKGGMVEFEAESFEYSDGFSLINDSNASGEKLLKSTKANAIAVLDVKFDNPISDMVMYVTHKAMDGESNLSYIFFEGMDGESLYTTEIDKLVQSRVYYGSHHPRT